MLPRKLKLGGGTPPVVEIPPSHAWWDFSDMGTLFLDTGGATPVTADGQKIARVSDKSGNGWHCVEPTALKQPTFKRNAEGTLSAALFGSYGYGGLIMPDGLLNGQSNITVFSVSKTSNLTAHQRVVSINTPLTTNGYFGIHAYNESAPSQVSVYLSTPETLWTSISTGLLARSPVLISSFVSEGVEAKYWANGNLFYTTPVTTLNSTPSGSGKLGNGRNDTRPNILIGLLYEVMVFVNLTEADRLAVELYLTEKWGVGAHIDADVLEPTFFGLRAYYTFDNVVGNTITDESNNGYDGTTLIAPTLVPAKHNNGIEWAGDNYVALPLEVLKTLSAGTISLFVNLPVITSGEIILALANNTTNTSFYYIAIIADRRLFAYYHDGSGNPVHQWASIETVPVGVTTHIAFVQTGSALNMYIGGVLVSKTRVQGSAPESVFFSTVAGTTNTARIGQLGRATPVFAPDGVFDSLRIFNVPLTDSEILALANETVPVPSILSVSHPDLDVFYTFDNVNGTTVADESINARNGTSTDLTITSSEKRFGASSGLFNGSTSRVRVPDKLHSSAYSMSVWAKPHANIISNSKQVGALYSAGQPDGNHLLVDTNLLLDADAVESAIVSVTAASNTENRKLFGGGASSYTWRHYCVTWDGVHNTGVSTPNLKLYVDGVLVDEIATNVVLDFTFQGDLGGDGSTTRNMNGWIDQFRMFNRPLTQQEVTDLYNEPVPFSPLDLSPIHWWDFSDTSRLYTDDGITKITADNQTIYRCDDKAGSANMIQTLSSKRPAYRNDAAFAVNGRGVASFDGVDDWLSTTATHAASNYTIFVVSITDDLMVDTEFDYVIDVESGRLVLCNRSNVAQGSTVEYYDSIGWQDTGFTGVTGLQSVTWKLESPAASSVRRNGVELASGMSYSQTAIGGVTSLASRYDGTSSNYSAKRYCEVIWYDTPLNASQILQVEQYLSDKWGV